MRSLRLRLALAGLVVLAGAAAAGWTLQRLHAPASASTPTPAGAPQASLARPPRPPPASGAPTVGGVPCADADYGSDALANAASLADPTPGADWAAYAPLVAHETGTACPADSAGFAHALAGWRAAHGLDAPGGAMDAPTLSALVAAWNLRRPFVRASAGGLCPASPPASVLATATPAEGYGGKTVSLLPGALAAWRRMAADVRGAVPAVAADPRLLTLVSGWRGPDEEAARCAGGACDGRVRARCSAHRTGAAVDLYLGGPVTSAAPADRLAQSRSPAYLWLVANADRYGFVPYAFEPWHWEWTGGA